MAGRKRFKRGDMKYSNSITKIVVTLFLTSILIAVPASAGYGTPKIDGIISEGEWGKPAFIKEGYFNVYALNDEKHLYLAFETLGGTYLPKGPLDLGLIKVQIEKLDSKESWTYRWTDQSQDEISFHYSLLLIPRPRTTTAEFHVSKTVFELMIPISELESIHLGDTVQLHFLSCAEGWTNRFTGWLRNQKYSIETPKILLQELVDMINDLNGEDFKNGKSADGNKQALLNKINAVIGQVQVGAFQGAKNKLKNDIKDKIWKWINPDPGNILISKVEQIINLL
jgi:hypothetical protein